MLVSPKTATDGRFRLTLEMFEVLSDAGYFANQHVELLNGELFVKGLQSNEHALLVVEVSDTTLERDRSEKLVAYARNAVPEYWIVNIEANELEVYREPDGKNYLSKRILKPNQPVSPLAFSDVALEWWA